jgi:hypothetical protein
MLPHKHVTARLTTYVTTHKTTQLTPIGLLSDSHRTGIGLASDSDRATIAL